MNNNKILKFVNPIRSLKLRVFVVIMLAIIIPALASSIFIVNVTTKNYLNKRINSFKANNTMLKNNIINNNYLDQPGASTIQGEICSILRPSLIMLPHSAAGGCTPSPRKESPASSIIMVPISRTAVTRI